MESIWFISELRVMAQSEPANGSRHGGRVTRLQVTLSEDVSWHMGGDQSPPRYLSSPFH